MMCRGLFSSIADRLCAAVLLLLSPDLHLCIMVVLCLMRCGMYVRCWLYLYVNVWHWSTEEWHAQGVGYHEHKPYMKALWVGS